MAFFDWIKQYQRSYLSGDFTAGVVVMIMLIPQGMAYAILAGLPPQVGLYASIAPLIVYGLLGSTRSLAVGPVAIDSLLVAAGISQLATSGSENYIQLALLLALMVGLIEVSMGFLRVGFLVNFLSHPVIAGFTNAAAFVIAVSQLKHVFGVNIPRTEHAYETLYELAHHLQETNITTLGLSVISIGILLYFKYALGDQLKKLGLPTQTITTFTKIGPLAIVALGTITVALFQLDRRASVVVVGNVPSGLPPIGFPQWHIDDVQNLLPNALTISFVGYMEAISVAKALASKRREQVNANQELVAIGAANISAALTGGYAVTGGLARSSVNDSAGANSGLASIITGLLMIIVVLFFTPLFHSLPQATLSAIILVAVSQLFGLKPLIHAWRYDRAEAGAWLVTFSIVLLTDIEKGVLAGVVTALAIHLWRTSRPHVAIVGRIGETEHFRNVLRYETQTYPNILAIRVDESLYFANAQYLEHTLMNTIAEHPEVKHLILVCSGINTIDLSALTTLETLIENLKNSGVTFYMAEVKGPVMDRLSKIGFADKVGKSNIFLNIHSAMETLVPQIRIPST